MVFPIFPVLDVGLCLSFLNWCVCVCVHKVCVPGFPSSPSVFFPSIVYQLFSTVAGTHRNSGSPVVFSLALPCRLIKLRHTCRAVQQKGRAVLHWSCPWKETAQVLSSLQFDLLFVQLSLSQYPGSEIDILLNSFTSNGFVMGQQGGSVC